MAKIGGDLLEISVQHPTAGSKIIYGVAGETTTIKLGGVENEDNGAVDGGQNLIVSKRLVPGHIQGPFANDNRSALAEFEFIQNVAASPEEAVFTFRYIDNEVYSGSGTPVGEITLDAKAATFTMKIVSGRGFTRQ